MEMGKRKTKQQTVLPTYRDMIETALYALHQRNGSYTHAIFKYIYGTFDVKDRNFTNRQLKLALKSGIRKGQLRKTKGCGAIGSFKLLMSRGSSKTKNMKMDIKIRNKTTRTKQSSTKKKNVTQSFSTKKKNMTQSSTKKKNVSQSSTKKRNATQSFTKKENVSQSSTKKKNVTQSSTKKNNMTQFKKNNVTQSSSKKNNVKQSSTKNKNVKQSSTKKNNVKQSSTKNKNVKQSSTKKNNVNQSSTKKKSVNHSSTKKTTTTSSSTKTNNKTLSKIKGKARRSSKKAETVEATILTETATTVVSNKIEGPSCSNTESSNTNFAKWSNVQLILSDSFNVRTPDDEDDVKISSLAMCPDGKIVVADYNNDTLKLFDHKGKHLYTVEPEHTPSELTIGNNSEILVSTFPFYDHIIQIFNVKDGIISVKETIKTQFRIVGLSAFEDGIIATVLEKDRIGNEIFAVKRFNRTGKVYWSTPLETRNNWLNKIVCIQEKCEILCIVREHIGTFMAKLNARTGELVRESSENADDEKNDACDIFYCSSENNKDYMSVCSSDFKQNKILASGEDGLGYWPRFVQYDEARDRFLIAYDSYSGRNDRIDIFKVVDAENRMSHIYRFVGKLNNLKQHVTDAVNRVFRKNEQRQVYRL